MKTVGSLFSGIGGLDLGLEWAGWQVVWQAETDPYASKVLKKHWPDIPNLGDVTRIDWEHVRRPDLVCGGFPCQPVSHAGARRGTDDDRWLWPEVLRCVRVVRPEWVLLENVPGLLTLGFGQIATDLAALGYDLRWDCIPAAAVGAPHLRYRIFVVGWDTSRVRRRQNGIGERVPELVAHTDRESEPGQPVDALKGSGQLVPDTERVGLEEPGHTGVSAGRQSSGPVADGGWWEFEPDVGRVAHGIPHRVDRLRCLGNAVVPQVAELVARMWLP